MEQPTTAKKSNRRRLGLIIVIVVIALAIFYGRDFISRRSLEPGYSAVFLSNGQVYFGKLSKSYGGFINLTDVYYLRAQRDLQADQPAEGEPAAPGVSLVKLGNELHGPTSEMTINKDHVLFIETLKNDSKVVEAINKEKQ